MSHSLDNALWIASSVVGGPATSAPSPYLRKSFHLAQPVRSAKLTTTALGLYECEINGTKVGDEVFAPGWTDYHIRVPYSTHDVTPLLRVGENVLGAILGDGWYCGYIGWLKRQQYGDRPRLRTALELVLADDSTFTIATDPTWQTAIGPILQGDFLMGESYDARLHLGRWSEPGYQPCSRWAPAVTAPPEVEPALVPRLGPPVRSIEEIAPTLTRTIDAWPLPPLIWDFGQNFTGRIRIRVRAERGRTITFRFAEVLNPDGSLYTDNLRSARSTDVYTCASNESETWESRFTFHGFRYVEATGPIPEDSVEITGVVLHSDTPPTGVFKCSSKLLNQLQHNIVWGQKSNFLEIPTDCPQRDERLGWTGDAQVFVRTACFNMDVREFFHKWLRDLRDSQSPAGAIPAVAPCPALKLPEEGGPAWSDAMIICPWTIYLCYGDTQILEDNYASMSSYLTYMETHRCKGRVRSHPDADAWGGFGDWLALDGSGRTEGGTPKDLIGTAFYAYDAEIMSAVATVLGRRDDAEK